MINETRKILNRPNLRITATAVRVPVLNSHSESINVEFEKDFDINELKSHLTNAPGIILKDNPEINEYPLARDASGQDKVLVGRARRIRNFLSQALHVAEAFNGLAGQYVKVEDTVRSFKAIVEGKYDDIPESYFLNCGSIEDVLAKCK